MVREGGRAPIGIKGERGRREGKAKRNVKAKRGDEEEARGVRWTTPFSYGDLRFDGRLARARAAWRAAARGRGHMARVGCWSGAERSAAQPRSRFSACPGVAEAPAVLPKHAGHMCACPSIRI